MTVRLGFVGAGFMTSVHLENLETIDAEAVAVADVEETAAREAAEPHGAAVYADHGAMYDAEELDAVVVAVPPFAHPDAELDAVERGLDVLVEKPLALEREPAREVARAVADAGVVAQAGYMNRYAASVERARELVGGRTLSLFDAAWHGEVPPAGWWHGRETGGGQVVEQSTHLFDLARYLAGDVDRVAAHGDRLVADELDFEDTTSATMHHDGGAVGHVSSTAVSPEYAVEAVLVGDGFRLRVDLRADELEGTVDGEQVRFQGDDRAWARELDAFVGAVAAGDPSAVRSPYADALRSFELTLAVEEALATGAPVEVSGAGGE